MRFDTDVITVFQAKGSQARVPNTQYCLLSIVTDLYTQIGNGTRLGERRADRFCYANEPISVHCPSFGSVPMCPDRLRLPSWLTIPAETGLGQLSQGSRYGSHHAPFHIVANRQWNTVNFIIARARNVFIWIYQTRIDPTILNFEAIFIDMPPALPEARKLIWQLSCQIRYQQDWQIYATCIICVCSQNCGLLSTHDLLIIHMNECTCMEFLWHFFSGFKPDAKIMGPEPCQNQPDARNISTIPVLFWHIMACNYLLNFGHHRLVYISSAAADGSSPSPSSSWPPVKVALDISGGPIENQWGSGKYPG